MRELIVFTIILLIALWNYKLLFEWIALRFGIVTPFLIWRQESLCAERANEFF